MTYLIQEILFSSVLFILFQLIDIVGSVLERPLIRSEFTAKYVEIIVMLEKEILTCEVSVHKLHK